MAESRRNKLAVRLEGLLAELAAFDPEVLTSPDLGKFYSFGEVRTDVETSMAIAQRVLSLNFLSGTGLGVLPLDMVVEFGEAVANLLNRLSRAREWTDADLPDPPSEHTVLVTEIADGAAAVFQSAAPALAVLASLQPDSTSDAEMDAVRLVEVIEEQAAKARVAAENIQALSSKSAVTVEETIFRERADSYDKTAISWLWGGGVLTMVAALYVLTSYLGWWTPDDTVSDREAIAHFASRFVLLSLILFAVGFSARNYSVGRHNAIVNRHRADSMKVFDSFMDSARTDDLKDAVLLEATKSVFRPAASGFDRSDGSDGQSPNTTVEIVRRMQGPS